MFRLFENEKEKFSSNKTYTDDFDKGASKENVIFRLKVFSSHYLAFFIDSVKIFKIDAKTPVLPKVYKKLKILRQSLKLRTFFFFKLFKFR